MALRPIKRVITRTYNPENVSKRVFPDLTFSKLVRKSQTDENEMIESLELSLSTAKFEELVLYSHEVGLTVFTDDETGKVYFGVVKAEDADALKGRPDKKKGRKFQYNEAVAQLVKAGLLPGDIEVGYKQTFDLVDSTEQVEGVSKLVELVKKDQVDSDLPSDEVEGEDEVDNHSEDTQSPSEGVGEVPGDSQDASSEVVEDDDEF